MAKNHLSDLRDHLFETIEALKDSDKPMDIDRAKAIVNAAQAVINSAKVEVAFINATGIQPSAFIAPLETERPKLLNARTK